MYWEYFCQMNENESTEEWEVGEGAEGLVCLPEGSVAVMEEGEVC